MDVETPARTDALVAAGVDAVVVDTAHGHSAAVLRTIDELRRSFRDLPIVGGNVATAEGAEQLIKAGVSTPSTFSNRNVPLPAIETRRSSF